jgi:enoyl-CoA hydratase/carnithine racemase
LLHLGAELSLLAGGAARVMVGGGAARGGAVGEPAVVVVEVVARGLLRALRHGCSQERRDGQTVAKRRLKALRSWVSAAGSRTHKTLTKGGEGRDMAAVSVQVDGRGVARVGMANGKVNAISDELIEGLRGALRELKAGIEGDAVKVVVLASDRERFYSPGFDLFALLEKDREGMLAFGGAYGALCEEVLSLPVYTVADMRGHAIAGGAVLSLCCDERLMRDDPGSTWALNEVAIGLPLPASLVELLRYRVSAEHVFEVALGAGRYRVKEAAALGLVRAHDAQGYEEALEARLQKYLGVAGKAFRMAKAASQRPILGAFAGWATQSEALFDALRTDSELQAQLAASMPKRSGA